MDLRRIALRIVRAQEGDADTGSGQFGGKGPFALPDDHVAAIQVPKGGSCCQNCAHVDAEGHACKDPNYVAWNGGDSSLPDLPLDEICSDWYSPASMGGEAPTGSETSDVAEP